MSVSDLQRIRELLPWYAQGALPPDEAGEVARWLESHGREHPELGAELAWLQRTGAQLQEEALAGANPAAAEAGLAVVMARIATEQAAPRRRSGWRDWLAPWRRLPAPTWWVGVPAALALVVLVQAVVIGMLLPETHLLEPLGGRTGAPAASVLLTVAFRPEATENAIRATLARAQAQIVAGPSALGLYTLSVPAAGVESSLAALQQATAVVESVQR